MNAWLLDTGPLIAALNRHDPQHARCVGALESFAGVLVTTGAVVTEAMHFVSLAPEGASALVDFLDDAQVDVRDCFSTSQMQAAARLMKKYRDTPMDFADATLVLLAEELGQGNVLTLDERGFRTYRFRGTRRFDLMPGKTE